MSTDTPTPDASAATTAQRVKIYCPKCGASGKVEWPPEMSLGKAYRCGPCGASVQLSECEPYIYALVAPRNSTGNVFQAEIDRLNRDCERLVRQRNDTQQANDSLVKDLNDCCDQRNALRETLRAVIAMLSQPVQFTETQDSANILRADARCAREMAAKALTERAAK